MDFVDNNTPSKTDMRLALYTDNFSNIIKRATVSTSPNKKMPLEQGMQAMINAVKTCRVAQGTVYIIGNGGSAAIASHVVIDMLNMVKVRATAMLDPAVTTCISNDYGYEHIYEKQIQQFVKKEDVLIAISSSGNSKNIINAVSAAKKANATTITLSGFKETNPLRACGDLNLWLNSSEYGPVEIGHAFVLHNITDRLCIK